MSGYILIVVVILVLGVGIVNAVSFYVLNQQGGIMMASLAQLQTKIDELTQAGVDREVRDVAQEGVTQQQIVVLQATIDELRAVIAGGTLSPENQAIVDDSIVKVQATIDSLNAADPTPPVIP